MTVDLNSNEPTSNNGNDRLYNIENVIGTDANDTLTGDGKANILFGEGGNDSLSGGAGNDHLYGGAGDDMLAGGTGADHLYGGAGTDTVTYAASAQVDADDRTLFANTDSKNFDEVTVSGGWSGVIVDLKAGTAQQGDAEGDRLHDVEVVVGSGHNDLLQGDSLTNDTLKGGAGDDWLRGLGGNDVLEGGAGSDTLWGDRGTGVGTYDGTAGDDLLIAGLAWIRSMAMAVMTF